MQLLISLKGNNHIDNLLLFSYSPILCKKKKLQKEILQSSAQKLNLRQLYFIAILVKDWIYKFIMENPVFNNNSKQTILSCTSFTVLH